MFCELRFDQARQADGVGRRLLLDTDDHCRSAHVSCIAALDAWRELDLGNLAQENAVSLARGHHEVAEIFEAVGEPDVADQVFAGVLVDEAAAGVDAKAANGGLHLGGRQFELAHHHRVRRHAVLPNLPADGYDLGNAGNGQHLRADDEVGDLTQLHRRNRRPSDGNEHDLAHDRGDRSHLRLRAMR